MELPTLDFADFTSGTKEQRQKLSSHLVQSFKDHGFVKLTNHGVPEDTVKTLFEMVRQPLSQFRSTGD
jgi:isopenicillin N synthase-like dioxygenase